MKNAPQFGQVSSRQKAVLCTSSKMINDHFIIFCTWNGHGIVTTVKPFTYQRYAKVLVVGSRDGSCFFRKLHLRVGPAPRRIRRKSGQCGISLRDNFFLVKKIAFSRHWSVV